MKSQRVIMITGDGLEHHYVANRLAQQVPLTAIIVDHGKPVSRGEEIRRYFRRYTVPQLMSRVALSLLRRYWRTWPERRSAVLSVLGSENCLEFKHPELLRHVHGINTPDGVRTVASFEPDVILVFGTGIVGNKVLSLARTLALNMHTGISPYYRGSDCSFWPLHNEEPQMLGATVHECVKEVDGGRIFGTTRVVLQADDRMFDAYARCVKAGAELYAAKVEELLENGLHGEAQDFSIGTEYKAVMRGVRAEMKVRKSIRAGLIRRYVEANRAHEQEPAAVPVAK